MTCTSTWGDPTPSTSLPQRPIFTSYASGSALLHDAEDDDNDAGFFEWESNLGVKRVRDGYEDSEMLQEHYQEGQVNPEKRQRVSCCESLGGKYTMLNSLCSVVKGNVCSAWQENFCS